MAAVTPSSLVMAPRFVDTPLSMVVLGSVAAMISHLSVLGLLAGTLIVLGATLLLLWTPLHRVSHGTRFCQGGLL